MTDKTIEQVSSDSPLTSVGGNELLLVWQEGLTKAGPVSVLTSWIRGLFAPASSTDDGLMTSDHFDKVEGLATVASTGSYSDLSDKPGVATQTTDGLMSKEDKIILDTLDIPPPFELEPATETELGGVLLAEAVEDADADVDTVEELRLKFNELLASLRAAGVLE